MIFQTLFSSLFERSIVIHRQWNVFCQIQGIYKSYALMMKCEIPRGYFLHDSRDVHDELVKTRSFHLSHHLPFYRTRSKIHFNCTSLNSVSLSYRPIKMVYYNHPWTSWNHQDPPSLPSSLGPRVRGVRHELWTVRDGLMEVGSTWTN